jgi:SSS family solute:Na+ symporter
MLSTSDIVVVIASLVAVYLAARRGRNSDAAGFLVAGRTLTIPFFVASLVATWYGAVLGSGEFILRYGVTFILCFGVPYYIVALLYAGFLSKRIHDAKAVSIPEQFGLTYGNKGQKIVAMLLLVITTPASYQLMIGILVSQAIGLPLLPSIIIGTIISVAYIVKGGLRSDVYANVVQVILMYAGMLLLVGHAIAKFGSPVTMWNTLPTATIEVPGAIGWIGVLGWFVIAMQTFIDPNFFVRTVAAADHRVARRGLAISVLCWIIFDSMQLLAGLYIVAYAPSSEPTSSYLSFAGSVLPPLANGVFFASLLAAVMSTLDGYALSSATMLAHDIAPRTSERLGKVQSYRLALVLVTIAGAVIAYIVPSIIDIIFYSGSIAVSAILVPLVISYTKLRAGLRRYIVLTLLAPAVAAMISLVGKLGEPIFVGLTTSVIITGLALLHERTTKTTRDTPYSV